MASLITNNRDSADVNQYSVSQEGEGDQEGAAAVFAASAALTITITLRTLSLGQEVLSFAATATVQDVLMRLQQVRGINPTETTLVFKGQRLLRVEDRLCDDVGVQEGDFIFFLQQTSPCNLIINLKSLAGLTTQLFLAASATVQEMLERLQQVAGVDPAATTVIFKGKRLRMEDRLCDVDVQGGDIVHYTVAL